jgi:hypothetical protein
MALKLERHLERMRSMLVLLSRRLRPACLALIALLVAAGCSGGPIPSAGPIAGAAPGTARQGSVRFVIRVPAKKKRGKLRHGRYVSPATQSMKVAITGNATQTVTVDLTPTSNGCSSTLATTTCTLSLGLPPGTYTAAVSTFDGLGGAGTLLSAGQALNFTIAAGISNNVPITLSGIPYVLRIESLSQAVRKTGASAFKLTGPFAGKMIAYALDADNNIIVGPGAPALAVTQTGGAAFTIANPVTASPNVFALTGSGTDGASGTFTLTASYADGTCSLAGAVCTAGFSVTAHVQTLFVNNSPGGITAYGGTYTGAPITLQGYGGGSTEPQSMAFDTAGNLYAADLLYEWVDKYAPPYTASPAANVAHVADISAIAIGPNGDLFVADYTGNAVDEYAPPFTGNATNKIVSGVSEPASLGFDGSSNLFVANVSGPLGVTEYVPPYNLAEVTVGGCNPYQIAVASSGDVFTLCYDASIQHLTPPYSGPVTLVPGQAAYSSEAVVIGPSGTLYFGNGQTPSVVGLASPYTAVSATVTSGITSPLVITFDGAADMAVVNTYYDTVTILAPPYNGTPITITSGINNPFDAAFSP